MHEVSLIKDLVRRVDDLVLSQGGKRAKTIRLKVGARSHLSGEHLRCNFEKAAQHTYAAGARLEWETVADLHDPHARDILLESLDIEF
jgi:Zn finger protein HypA/HybF involved in hydrogenase expression